MKYDKVFLVLAFSAVASAALAHIRVLPFESKTATQQTYTMKVPTEGAVATTWVELEVPAGLSVTSVSDPAEIKKLNGKATSIVWKVEIPPGASRDFNFIATNPSTDQDMAWKAHQHFADGTSRDWVDLPKTKSPASITKLSANPN